MFHLTVPICRVDSTRSNANRSTVHYRKHQKHNQAKCEPSDQTIITSGPLVSRVFFFFGRRDREGRGGIGEGGAPSESFLQILESKWCAVSMALRVAGKYLTKYRPLHIRKKN